MVTAAVASGAVDFTAAAGFMAAVDFMAVPSVAVVFATGAFAAVLTAVAFATTAFAAALTVVAFAGVAFAAIGSTMATSTTGSSSLTALETRSFTIPIHTMDITPTAIIRMAIILTVTDTVALVEMAFAMATFTAVVFKAAAFMAVVFTAVALTAMAPLAIDDSYNEHVHQCRAGCTKADSRR